MQVIKKVSEMNQIASQCKAAGKKIGFVPTMGYLHQGHTTLIDRARQEADIVITSIFVNPLQFGPNEDFERYPRDEVRDQELAKQHQVDYLFMPTVEEMYPTDPNISLHVEKRTDALCGKSRPGHFDGVVTVLTKLFHITCADVTYFGLKDAQQVAVVHALITDFNFPTEIIAVPTVREADGLAKSSRNVYLNEQERKEAKYIYQALQTARQLIVDDQKNPDMIVENVKRDIEQQIHGGRVDYVELLSYPYLTPVSSIEGNVIIAVAVQFSKARLIDNIIIDEHGQTPEGIY
ncbi:pantoate--beta-alanine ligase [Gracilibacillus alcaliphilus]|uniref:pantoate--beta-alanine ligase n=1 Tax=Gracilibacillus alcaliphilus TaxID=1401441 RepID=UPI00195AC9E3|nr:pantoate--beta-alanine ligase [Gracilibacillus alcaliphilus]MBM7675213.1 pantoate--beta-alanine ligase [Gracilibacillus alcaliphilus]